MAARRAAGDAPRADRMGGTAPSFMATRASVRCSTPMWLSCRAFASRRECSRVFLSRRSEEHTSELQSRPHLVCRLLLEKKKTNSDGRIHLNKKRKEELRS